MAAKKTYDLRLFEVVFRLADPTSKTPRNAEIGEFLYLSDEQAALGLQTGGLRERSLRFAKKGDLTGKLPVSDNA